MFFLTLFYVLEANSVKIRRVMEEDVESIHNALNTPDVALRMSATPYPLKLEDVENWYVSSRINWLKELTYSFSIVNEESNEFIGLVELRRNEFLPEHAEIGYWLKTGFWGRGYATNAVSQAIHFGFTRTPVVKLEGHCLHDNHSSIRVLEKNQFIHAGLFKKFMPARNKVGLYVRMLLLRR